MIEGGGISLHRLLRALMGLLCLSAWASAMPSPEASGAGDEKPLPLAEVPVTSMDVGHQPANNSPMLAAHPDDDDRLALAARRDGPDFSCTLHVSGDGGRGWMPVNPIAELPDGAEKCYAPEVAFGPDGALHYQFVGLHGKGNSPMGVYLTSAPHWGAPFSPPLQVLGERNYMVRMAIDPAIGEQGRIHLVWLAAGEAPSLGSLPAPPNPIMSAYSDDGGRTFSTPVQVSDADRPLAVAPALSIGPERRVHVLYYDLGDDTRDYRGLEGPTWSGRWSLVLASSEDGGGSFSRGVEVDSELLPPERVMLIFTMPAASMIADGHGNLYIAWTDARNGDWDVLTRRSSDHGRTWEAPQRLNDDALGNGRHQYLPRLAIAPDGRIDAIFYDRRHDPLNIHNHVMATFSEDGGRTFRRNRRITAEPSDSTIGPRYAVPSAAGLVEFGSRLALHAGRTETVAAWTDTRNTPGSGPGQDIFATRITHANPGLPLGWVAVGTAGAVTLAALGKSRLWRRKQSYVNVMNAPDGLPTR